MAQNDKPVIVTLSCEATPRTATEEIDRAEWDAMTPSERARMLTDMAVEHINSSGGGGWWIDDPEDSAAADAVGGDPEPDPLRELAEYLTDRHHADTWCYYEFPNGYHASVVLDPDAPLRFLTQVTSADGEIEGAAGLTTDQVEAQLVAVRARLGRTEES